MSNRIKGAIACGHPQTAAAAAEILRDGGTAFDAVLAGFCAATVAEPVFCSLGGGGFLLAGPAGGTPLLYDFFVQTPRRRRNPQEIDFFPVNADFGTAKQEFHIGLGAMATPGAIKGLFEAHRDLGRLPIKRIVEPAVRIARDGFELRDIDAFVLGVVGAILQSRPDGAGSTPRRTAHCSVPGKPWSRPTWPRPWRPWRRRANATFTMAP